MSSKRPPAPPPPLPGYQYISHLGSGGFADVYLYEQDRPRRKVAVKVLLSDLKTEDARRRFESEANLMAQLSSHPYIVTIFEAETTGDGHSYLAMEYCSRPSLDVRYRRQRFSVDEVLAVGIQVASAVETAHRAGIVHRDIKPANILVTDYNRPALTDFGISGTIGDDSDDEAGMSIPWSPPEQFRGGPVEGVPVDVWALGATLYTLLAGRSPFVMPGQDNSQRELISRITNSPVPRLGRADVPESLELVLSTAMAKAPGSRYSSAHAFALALQRIQAELNLSVTPFEVLAEPGGADDIHPDDSFEETRVRSVASIDPDGGTSPTGSAPTFPARTFPNGHHETRYPAPAAQTAPSSFIGVRPEVARPAPQAPPRATPQEEQNESTVLRGWTPSAPEHSAPGHSAPGYTPPAPHLSEPDLAATVNRPAAVAEDDGAETAAPDHRKRNLVLAAVGAAVLVVAVVVGIVLGATAPQKAQPMETNSKPPADALDNGVVPDVANLAAKRTAAGKLRFTWTNPQPQDGDTYKWRRAFTADADYHAAKAPAMEITENSTGRTCIQVIIVRSDGNASPAGDSSINCYVGK
ncbi:serine/threonine-protein kinase [Arthrobacter cupressi]|uniref:non-specific serine/threonine protein kinase n=1 Tax=Arthrobacter cupressi TaxID=1045773 RepID=A0A1G8J4C0_9MICC|nr:serine/threonine-protein kinase [Arthrobacter cupressi]NYD79228.1 serine/threonine protein kinase [Arthrobacter cupressi]SDI26089.1 Serine/threonine protein kinase [Arthrobacter cupressi]